MINSELNKALDSLPPEQKKVITYLLKRIEWLESDVVSLKAKVRA